MADHPFLTLAEPYALGVLDAEDRSGFEAHLASCVACQGAVEANALVAPALAAGLPAVLPRDEARRQLLDLAAAPRWPIDLSAYVWEDLAPGIRIHVLDEDAQRGMRQCLVWAQPGARMGTHRHGGDECILVLKGGLRDDRGEYHAGELCRSLAGSVHHEEVLSGEDCVCFVVYYGPLEFL